MSTTKLEPLRGPPAPRTGGQTMKAVVQDRYSPAPEDLFRVARIDRPTVGEGEVLVRVAAASVDRGTWHILAGLPYPIRLAGFGVRRPSFGNPGVNLAGTVVERGTGVTEFQVGDEVFGVGRATFAEFAVASAGKLARKPVRTDFVTAATVPVSGLTALQAVRDHGRVRAGDPVLVYGASGGVGSFAVQLAVAAGATVTAVCSSAKTDRVSALGASRVVPYETEEVTGPFEVILDTGGNRPLNALRRLLTRDGRLVIIGGETGGRLLGGSSRQLRAQALSPFVRQTLGTFLASVNGDDLAVLAEMMTSGALHPLVDRVYPLAETPAAI